MGRKHQKGLGKKMTKRFREKRHSKKEFRVKDADGGKQNRLRAREEAYWGPYGNGRIKSEGKKP